MTQSAPPPVCLVMGFRSIESGLMDQLTGRFALEFGEILARTERWSNETTLNEGASWRQWLALTDPLDPAELAGIKQHTLRVEQLYLDDRRSRRVRLEVAGVDAARVVRTTDSNAAHRIYLGGGIWAEVALRWHPPEGYVVLPWTEPDFADPRARAFLGRVREQWLRRLAGVPPGKARRDG